MERLLTELRKRRTNQKGFTLIEMLVVISILGILAAVVTLSMVGITSTAKRHAQDAELQTIQVAMDTMAADKSLAKDNICPAGTGNGFSHTSPTSDMLGWPSTTNSLYPDYIRTRNVTQQGYWCDADGTVHGTVSGP